MLGAGIFVIAGIIAFGNASHATKDAVDTLFTSIGIICWLIAIGYAISLAF